MRSDSPEETREIARRLGACIEPLPRGGLTILLRGDLGAGKTVFAGGLFRGLGLPDGTPVPSPTFTVARAYLGRMPIHHLDAYHVRHPSELEAAGFEDMGGDGRVTCVEWGDRVPSAFATDRLEVTMTPVADASSKPQGKEEGTSWAAPRHPRTIELAATGPATQKILDRFALSWGRRSSEAGAVDPGATTHRDRP